MARFVQTLGIVSCLWMFALAGAAAAADQTTELDFQQACGVAREKLEAMLDCTIRESGRAAVPLAVSLRNEQDECLVRGDVTFLWNGGEEKVAVPPSGMIAFTLTKEKLDEFRIRVPAGYTRLTQFTFPTGPAFLRPDAFERFGVPIINDGEFRENMQRQLVQIKREGKAANPDVLRGQLMRKRYPLKLAEPPAERLSPEEIYRRCRPSVVVMGTLANSGQVVQASGFILDPSGIVVTNHHVMNKHAASVAVIAVLTADGRAFPVREVLAADQTHDVAIVRIDAKNLPAVALSHGEQPGAPVTVIAHPADRFYFLTQGNVSRYSTWINCGRQMASMSITADFCPGSSGGPVFAASGAVAGIVASIKDLGGGMVDKQCVPAQAIRDLFDEEPVVRH